MTWNQGSLRTVCSAALIPASAVAAVDVASAADDRLAAQDEVTADEATTVFSASIQPSEVGRAPILGLLLGLAMVAFSLARRTSR